MIIGTFHGQNVKKCKKDKVVTLSFPKFVSFHELSVQEELRILEIFFTIFFGNILCNSFLSLLKTENVKRQQTTEVGFLSRK